MDSCSIFLDSSLGKPVANLNSGDLDTEHFDSHVGE